MIKQENLKDIIMVSSSNSLSVEGQTSLGISQKTETNNTSSNSRSDQISAANTPLENFMLLPGDMRKFQSEILSNNDSMKSNSPRSA